MNRDEYNGWTNYETWAVNLWIGNEEWSSRRLYELAREARDEAGDETTHNDTGKAHTASGWRRTPSRAILAERLKDWITSPPEEGGFVPDLGATLAADLIAAALSEVDWYEIAAAALAE